MTIFSRQAARVSSALTDVERQLPPFIRETADDLEDVLNLIESAMYVWLLDYEHLPGKHHQGDHGRKTGRMANLAKRIGTENGFTYSPYRTPKSPKSGIAVSTHEQLTKVIAGPISRTEAKKAVQDYMRENRQELEKKNTYAGAWVNTDDGSVHFDIVTLVDTETQAQSLMRQHNQLASYDLATGREIRRVDEQRPVLEHLSGKHNQQLHAGGRGRAGGGGGVSSAVLDEYRSTNILSPMSPAVTDVRVGAAQIGAIADGETTWGEYAGSNFTKGQLDDLGRVTTAVHANNGIPFVIAGHEKELSAAQLDGMRRNMDNMLAAGMPRQGKAYKYDEKLGVAIVQKDRFSNGYDAIKERVFVTALNHAGIRASKPVVSAANARKLDDHFRNNPDQVGQLRSMYAAARSAVDMDTAGERGAARAQRQQYDLNKGGKTGFRVTKPLAGMIDNIDSNVLTWWRSQPADKRPSLDTLNQFVDDITRRYDQPTEGAEQEWDVAGWYVQEHITANHGPSDQKKHAGGRGGGDLARLPEAQQKALHSFMAANGLTHAEGVARVTKLYEEAASKNVGAGYGSQDQTAVEAGKGFYSDHKLDQAAKEVGISEEQMIGMTAALSPRSQWQARDGSMPNLDRAKKIARALKDDPEVNIDDAVIREWNSRPKQSRIDMAAYKGRHKLSELPPEIVARISNNKEFAGSGSNSGFRNAEKAVRIYRGEAAADVIGASSPKVRAFAAAFASRGKSPTPVIDAIMTKAITGRDRLSDKEFDNLLGGPNRPPRQGWQEKAGYNFMADIVSTGAKNAGVNVHDFQAIVWYSWQADH